MEAQLLPKGPLDPLLEGWDLPGEVTKGSPTHMSHLHLSHVPLSPVPSGGGHCCTRVPNGEAKARARARGCPSGSIHCSPGRSRARGAREGDTGAPGLGGLPLRAGAWQGAGPGERE